MFPFPPSGFSKWRTPFCLDDVAVFLQCHQKVRFQDDQPTLTIPSVLGCCVLCLRTSFRVTASVELALTATTIFKENLKSRRHCATGNQQDVLRVAIHQLKVWCAFKSSPGAIWKRGPSAMGDSCAHFVWPMSPFGPFYLQRDMEVRELGG